MGKNWKKGECGFGEGPGGESNGKGGWVNDFWTKRQMASLAQDCSYSLEGVGQSERKSF